MSRLISLLLVISWKLMYGFHKYLCEGDLTTCCSSLSHHFAIHVVLSSILHIFPFATFIFLFFYYLYFYFIYLLFFYFFITQLLCRGRPMTLTFRYRHLSFYSVFFSRQHIPSCQNFLCTDLTLQTFFHSYFLQFFSLLFKRDS